MSRTLISRMICVSAAAVGLLIVRLLVQDFQAIDAGALGKDAAQNVRFSVNLAKYGIYSGQQISPDVVSEYRREPLPNFLLAGYLRLADVFSPGLLDQVGQPFNESFLLFIKRLNLLLACSLFLGL